MSLTRRMMSLTIATALASALIVTTDPSNRALAASTVTARKARGVQQWSDPATWGGALPSKDDQVRIPSGAAVKLDTSPPELAGLQVDGTLSFAEKNLELKTDWLIVHGTLRIGKETKLFRHRAVITLTGEDRSVNVMDMGTKVLGIMGGNLELHGRQVQSWTQLDRTAEPGDREIAVTSAAGWKPGDRVVVASTDYWRTHDEERTVTWVSGSTLELDQPLVYQHWGRVQNWGEHQVDERAEVGLLTRNILIRGSETNDGFGGHTMIMEGSRARIENVEFANMGQRNALRRYPVHFHMDGDAPESYLKGSAIRNSSNRCVTIHGTNELTVKNNVCFDHVGHGFFMEDGAETDNVIAGNLGLGTRGAENGLLPTDQRPATFWITNPDNIVKNNVAAGSDGFGFWYALPEHPTGLSEQADIWPRRTPLGEFSGNTAHSNGDTGLNVDDGPKPNGHTDSTWYRPVTDPSNRDSEPVVARFEDLTAYMNRDRGVWLRGENHVVTDSVLADNRAGATFASSESFLENSFVVGETANMGTPEPWEESGPGGRALPLFWDPETPIVGFEFYDGRVGVADTTFAGFNGNSLRESGALGYLAPNAFGIHPKNFSRNVDFIDSNPVYLADPEPGQDGDLSKVFVDQDGSVTGSAGSTVVVDNPFLLRASCESRNAWNAHVCVSDYVSFMVGAEDPRAIKPVTLRRSDGVTQTLMGCCDNSQDASTTVIPDRAYEMGFNGGTPDESRFVLYNGKGRWVQVVLPVGPGFSVTRWGQQLASVNSLVALASRTDSGYFYDVAAGMLHVKVSGVRSDWEEIRVQR